MAKTSCALCGLPLGMFEKRELTCCGESQIFCLSCYDELSPMNHIQRTRVLLKEGRAAVNVESMQKSLDRIDAEEAAKRKAESTDLKCLRCGQPMAKVGRKRFQMGEENFFFDTHAWSGSMVFDIMRCTACGKAEFFVPDYVVSSAPEKLDTCPKCGAKYAPGSGCPRCAVNNANDRISTAPKASKKPAEKPPWER